MPSARLRVEPQLWFLLRRARRCPQFEVEFSASDTVGHVVQMVGIPLTEAGPLRVDGSPAAAADPLSPPAVGGTGRPGPVLEVAPRPWPQRTRYSPASPRFLLDVHLGSLARRLRLLGIDTAYRTGADDDSLVAQAVEEVRVLLSRDRGLLSRTALPEGALVRASSTPEQVDEVLRRFRPVLVPWTRCVRCNGTLRTAAADEVVDELEPGTRRTYREFSRCQGCGRVYWRGAHTRHLESLVRQAEAALSR